MTADGLLALTDRKAERATLGAMLIDPDAIQNVADMLQPSDYYDERYRHTYEAIRALYAEGGRVDYLTVCNRLEANGHLKEIGGAASLTGLINDTPTSVNVAHYAKIINRLGTLRRLVQVAQSIAEVAYKANGSRIDEVFDRVQRLVDAVTPAASDDAVMLWLDSLERFVLWQLDRVEREVAVEAGNAKAGAVFPWAALRRFDLDIEPGMVCIVAADSSVGKTTFMECCAEYWARLGLKVVFFHLELSHQVMLDRRMVRLAGVTMAELKAGLMDHRTQAATRQMESYSGSIHYVHCPGWTAQRIASTARQLAAKGECDVVIIDYLQKLRLTGTWGHNKAQALGEAMETVKTHIAEQLGIPTMIASQTNRAASYASRKTGDHIRDSGEPQEKANIVLVLDRPILDDDLRDVSGAVVANEGQRSPVMTVRVDKNTLGETGDTELVMNGARYLILDKQQREGLII